MAGRGTDILLSRGGPPGGRSARDPFRIPRFCARRPATVRPRRSSGRSRVLRSDRRARRRVVSRPRFSLCSAGYAGASQRTGLLPEPLVRVLRQFAQAAAEATELAGAQADRRDGQACGTVPGVCRKRRVGKCQTQDKSAGLDRSNVGAAFGSAVLLALLWAGRGLAEEFDCIIEASKTVEVRAASEGLIEKIWVDRGDHRQERSRYS
jgi:hypothetical protein